MNYDSYFARPLDMQTKTKTPSRKKKLLRE